ncbi:response regulator transcription factor [Aestuariispira insulae]|uniref:Response regulator receiver domain-containing protein n=1 Tax=Aestuariispira insulae TaxID=1461337 RepID=A0A3D9HQ47_9PROT|nr:response regulator [Aestuariispira insulae]RED51617.1 response regulator receiver domain-containing protein [Aestuariispira insulae]
MEISTFEEDTESTILVIDDEELVLDTLSEILSQEGYIVETAKDGREGIFMINSGSPDLIICDVNMPNMNGHEFVRELRDNHPDLSYIPILLLSGASDDPDITKGLKTGADDYLTKPINPDILASRVNAALRQIDRMKRKKRSDEVKLYRALVLKGKSRDSEQAPLSQTGTMDPANIPPAFQECLAKMHAENDGKSCGSVQLFSLCEYENIFGEEWNKYATKAMSIAETTIKHHLGSGDQFSANGENGFLLLFPKLDEAASKARVQMIADEIRVNLLGEEARVYRTLSIETTNVPVTDICDANGKITQDGLETAFGGISAQAPAPYPTDAGLSVSDRVMSQIDVRFVPVWNSMNEEIFAYQCVPYRKTAYGMFKGPDVLHGREGDPLTLDLDLTLAQSAVDNVLQNKSGEYTPSVCLPLHFCTLFGRGRASLQKILAPLKGKSNDFIIYELSSIPSATTQNRIWDAMRFLKEYGEQIAIELPILDRNVPVFQAAGAKALKVCVSDRSDHVELGRFTHDLKKMVTEIDKQKLFPYFYDVDTINLFKAADASGAIWINGRVVGPVTEKVRQSFTLPRRKILFG